MKLHIIFILIVSLFLLHSSYAQGEERQSNASSLDFQTHFLFKTSVEDDFKNFKTGASLHSGDLYKIRFKPNRPCFVYIYQVDSLGQVFQLFPMESFNGVKVNHFNPVRANRYYELPGSEMAFILDKTTGRERIYFIASHEKAPWTKSAQRLTTPEIPATKNDPRSEQSDNQSPQTNLDKYFKRRGLTIVKPDNESSRQQSEALSPFKKFEEKLRSLDEDNYVQVVEFLHL